MRQFLQYLQIFLIQTVPIKLFQLPGNEEATDVIEIIVADAHGPLNFADNSQSVPRMVDRFILL
jgi:hypothetical protein